MRIVYYSRREGCLLVTATYDKALLPTLRALDGGGWDKRLECWRAAITPGNVKTLLREGFSFDEAAKQAVQRRIDQAAQRKRILTGPLDIPGLRGVLRAFQEEGVRYIEAHGGRALIADEMGLGKTIQALAWAQLHPELRPLLVVCPACVKLNWACEAAAWTDEQDALVLEGRKAEAHDDASLIVVNYDILPGWVEELRERGPKIIVLDECFPAGTQIDTPAGPRNIETLLEGDVVLSAMGAGEVLEIGKRQASSLLRLHLSNGRTVLSTPSHPFFTRRGWLPAGGTTGEELLALPQILGILRQDTTPRTEQCHVRSEEMRGVLPSPLARQEQILRHLLLCEMEEQTTSSDRCEPLSAEEGCRLCGPEESPREQSRMGGRILQTDALPQPDEPSGSNGEDQRGVGANRTPNHETTAAGRKRKALAQGTAHPMGRLRTFLESGASYPNRTLKTRRNSQQLQGGPSPTRGEDLDRGGRMEPHPAKAQKARQEEREDAEGPRVVRIEILESPSGGGFEGHPVFNLEVSGHPTYFANGVLVHNCHYTKNRKAARTTAVKDLCSGVPHVLALSGTPILSRPIEFYETLAMLAPKVFGNWWWYINQFCGLTTGYGGAMDIRGASNTDKLHTLLKQHVMIRRLKADVLPELPAKTRTRLPLTITNRNEYNRACLDFRGWLLDHEGRELDGGVALARVEALRQLSLAGKMAEATAWIRDTLESVDKLVVFTWHKDALAALRGQFASICTSLDGDTPPLQRNACVQRFQQDPECRLFLGNIKAAGVGITLHAASNVVFLELPWTPGEVVQAEDRLHRIGQSEAVNVWFLLAQGTIDEDMHALLDAKLDTVSGVLDGKGASLDILPDLLWRFKRGGKAA